MTRLFRFTALLLFSTSMLLPSETPASTAGGFLSLVPGDAFSVGVVRVEDMRRSPAAQSLFAKMSAGATEGEVERLLREAGLRPSEDVDLLLVALSPSPASDRPRLLVAAGGRFDPVRLGSVVESRGGIRKSHGGVTYFLAPETDVRPGENPTICFPTANLVLAGTEDAVVATLELIRRGGGDFQGSQLGRQMFRIDPRASGWLLFDLRRAEALRHAKAPAAGPFGNQTWTAVKNISLVTAWVAETGGGVEFGSTAVSTDAETRTLVEDLLKGALSSLRMAAQEKSPEVVKIVRRFRVTSSSDSVSLNGTVPAAMIDELIARVK